MAIKIIGGNFSGKGTFFRGPADIDLLVSGANVHQEGTTFDIFDNRAQNTISISPPEGASKEEVVELIKASSRAIIDGRDPMQEIRKTPAWEKWAGLGADFVTVATPIVQFAMSLLPK